MNASNMTTNGNQFMTLVSCKYICGTNTKGSRRTMKCAGHKAQRVGYYEHDDDTQAVREYFMQCNRRAENITIRGVNNPRNETDNTAFYVVTYNEVR